MNESLGITQRLIHYCNDPSDVALLKSLNREEIRQILPFLVRLRHCHPTTYDSFIIEILKKIRKFEECNLIRDYLDANFVQINDDVIKHLSTRKKTQTISVYSYNEFENSTPHAKLLMISNILLNGNIRNDDFIGCKYCSIDNSLFDIEIYFDDLSDILCIIHAELGEVISLSQLIFTLLHTQSSTSYMLKLLANSVDSVFQIIDTIIDGCNCAAVDHQRHKCLLAISTQVAPFISAYIMNECLRHHYLPTVILSLARENKQLLITTLQSIFRSNEIDRNWFVTFLRSSSKNTLEKQSIDSMREELIDACYTGTYQQQELIKLYSSLRVYAGLKFNDQEVKALMNLIEKSKETSLVISFLLIYPQIYENDQSNFNRIIQWMKDNFEQNLFLIAIYCSSSQLQLLNDFVSNLLGFKCILKVNSLFSMSKIFQQVFPDEMLINEYLKQLPIACNLNTNTPNSSIIGIYFLNQLIKNSSILNKRDLKLNEWLFEQILTCGAPIHSIIVQLINNYILLLFNPNIQNEFRLVPIDKVKISDFFKLNSNTYSDEKLTPKLLLFYYLLIYEEKRRELIHQQQNGMHKALNIEHLVSHTYPREIYDFIEINYLLLKSKSSDYFIIYPSLIRLFTNAFPQLCQLKHHLYFDNRFITSRWNNFELILKYIEHIKCNYDYGLKRSLLNRIKQEWFRAYSIYGRRMSLKTLSILLDQQSLKYQDIYTDPLILLRTQNEVLFKCGQLLEILLYITKECLIASKSQFDTWLIDNHPLVSKETRTNLKLYKEREEMKFSLAATQEVSIIQTLLDVYLKFTSDNNEMEREEIKCLICSYIHHTFIENTSLAELVHFQTYNPLLIDTLVNGVPSMHICLDFIPRILAHNDLNRQIFAIKLTASLCAKYPIVKTFNVAKLAINVAFTLLQTLILSDRRKLLHEIANSIVLIYHKLPSLTQDCMSLIFNAVKSKALDVDKIPVLVIES